MPQLVHIFVSAQIFGFAQMRFIHDVTPARVFAALQLQIRLAPPDPRGGCRRLHQAQRQRDDESFGTEGSEVTEGEVGEEDGED